MTIEKSDSSEKQKNSRTWIFQANPSKYRIEDSLRFEKEEYWNLNQHAKEIHVGDQVLIWISGADSGIYAFGTVVTEPVSRKDSAKGMTYWARTSDGQRLKPRVLVRYKKILLDNPLLKVFIKCDPALWNLSILQSPRGTNFPVEEEEWRVLESWLKNAPL